MIIKLTEYKDPAIYTNFFDVVIKKVAVNRDIYLEDLDISPSTYKRVKNHESKRGKLIIEKLSDHFNYKTPTDEFIDELEEKFNKIYHNVYYKIETEYENDLEYLDELLKENYIIYPLIELMKLFVIFHYPLDTKIKFEKNKDLYESVKSYLLFYNNDLVELYELFNILSSEDIDTKLLVRDYKNELCYSALSTRLFKKGRYVDCLYLSEKIKKQYIIDENYKRIFPINLNIIACYNSLEEYESSYDLSRKQMLTLDSIGTMSFYRDSTENHYLAACFGLGKFQEIINILDNNDEFTMKSLIMLLVSKFLINKQAYLEYLNLLLSQELSEKSKELLRLIDDFLNQNETSAIDQLSNPKYNIPSFIITIIKKMFEVKN